MDEPIRLTAPARKKLNPKSRAWSPIRRIEDDKAAGEIYEPCNDNLQHHGRMDVDSDFYAVGRIADRASLPPHRPLTPRGYPR